MSKRAAAPAEDEPAAEWVELDKLAAWKDNPRVNDHVVDSVVESVRKFGFGAPLLARRATGEIIAGHTRLKAAHKLGLSRVPVRYLDLSEEQAHLLALADNRLAEKALWSLPGLHALLGKYDESEAAIAGWSGDELAAMAQEVLAQSDSDKEIAEDEVPELPAVPITKLGDVWQLGRHRLICGDSTDPQTFARLLGDRKVGLMVTDPPYGVSVAGGAHDPRDPNYRKGHERGGLANDELTGERLEQFLRAAYQAVLPALAPGAAWYTWYADRETLAVARAAEVLGGFRHILAWVKPNFVFGRADYHYRHEPCLYGWTPGAAHVWLGDRKQSSVFEVARDGAVAELKHPTVKPVHLYAVPIANHLGAGGCIVDPFAGSGPAVSAAEQTGRTCYAAELSPAFCDVIVERWQALSGSQAQRS